MSRPRTRRLEESVMRNDDLLEKVSELDGEATGSIGTAHSMPLQPEWYGAHSLIPGIFLGKFILSWFSWAPSKTHNLSCDAPRLAVVQAEELRTQIEAKTAECEKLRDVQRLNPPWDSQLQGKSHCLEHPDLTSELESARIELATKEASWKEELVSFEADKARIIELELGQAVPVFLGNQEKLRKEVEDERLRHEDSKAANEREVAGKSIEMRRRVKDQLAIPSDSTVSEHVACDSSDAVFVGLFFLFCELEEQLEETQVGLSAAKTKEVEEAKSQADTEIQRVTALLEVSDLERELADSRAVLEDAQRELGERSAASASVQALSQESAFANEAVARDEALSTLEALKEFLDRANSQAASLDGRLTGQRMLFEETSEALSRSEATEQQMSLELAEKVRELASEHELARSALERAQEQAAREVREREERHASTLQSEEVCMQRQMRAEVDAASRETSEAKEEQQRLQARLDRSLESISQAQSQHEQQLEGHRGSTTELRTRLSEAEERTTSEEREVERLGRAAEATKLEAERVTMAHKLEVERLQAMLEADSQSRSSAEQIATSKLEEKDTLLEYRESSLQRAQAELEDARKRISDFEETVSKMKHGVELKASHLSVRNAELEGELRRRNEHIQEVEGRLDAQRQYLEQLNSTLSEAQVDRESLKDAKGTLEAQLHLEQSHKDAVATSLATAQEDSSLRINELEERAARESEAHRAALAEVKVSLSEELRQGSACSASMEEELRSMRERCEILLRQKADLQQQVGEKQELQTSFEAQLQEQRAEQERLKLELEQLGRGRQQLEDERDRTLKERRDRDSQIKLLKDQVADVETHRGQQCDGFDSKVKQLDDPWICLGLFVIFYFWFCCCLLWFICF
ncbi:unnamed protein product [Polarella glacialis]|uniref:Uncharacterized protein n=1 Tax=Polarella glacialis TaxID=89957 RepID=A0A813JG20_POLGL|nr:unnamed protein product [Polarella glacialis]